MTDKEIFIDMLRRAKAWWVATNGGDTIETRGGVFVFTPNGSLNYVAGDDGEEDF